MKADIELLQEEFAKGNILTKNQQLGIEQYQEVVANLEMTKYFLETFDKQKLQTFSKTEVDVATIMKSRTSKDIQKTSTILLSPDIVAVQRDEILRLKKLLDEATKKEEDHKNKSPSINSSINVVNVSQIMNIMRALAPVIKDYKNNLIILGHVINGSIFILSTVSIAFIIILLFLDYDKAETRPWVKSLSIAMLIVAVITNCFYFYRTEVM